MDLSLLLTHWFWFGLAVVLGIFELIFGASFFLLWLGLVALAVGMVVALAPALAWQYQLLLFAGGSIVSILLWRHYLKNYSATTDRPTLNRRAEHYVHRTFVLSEAIVNGRGKIKVDDSTWSVEGPDLPMGTTVVVVGVEGVILKVKVKAV